MFVRVGHVSNGGSDGMMPTAGLELAYPHGYPRSSFGTKRLGGESHVMFVKR